MNKLKNKYEVIFGFWIKDDEIIEVVAHNEEQAKEIAEKELNESIVIMLLGYDSISVSMIPQPQNQKPLFDYEADYNLKSDIVKYTAIANKQSLERIKEISRITGNNYAINDAFVETIRKFERENENNEIEDKSKPRPSRKETYGKEIRAVIFVNGELLEKIKDIAYWQRKDIKDVINESFEDKIASFDY